jgi:hypothetical protein
LKATTTSPVTLWPALDTVFGEIDDYLRLLNASATWQEG